MIREIEEGVKGIQSKVYAKFTRASHIVSSQIEDKRFILKQTCK